MQGSRFRGLSLVWIICPTPEVLACKDIVIVAIDTPVSWKSDSLQSDGEDHPLPVPVEVGDILHFKFSDVPHPKTHGITTQNDADQAKVQKRGEPGGPSKFLQELGDGPSRFGETISGAKPNEEMTKVQVLAGFKGTLNLMCVFHGVEMLMTLKLADEPPPSEPNDKR